ncbi:hypothetical protein M408DRAFT_118139 [Serendipita vermifera MAFF 305830]|uniref:Uncharacterized protein n=1 Tax=Serendipita vermifera MAFF 305830 TaxID=933852 RepID=A0A0C3A8H2_SERVB|nr:hypothetical protein M408DRAFT_118139 [Serendipita vermifera MAFF 305830]
MDSTRAKSVGHQILSRYSSFPHTHPDYNLTRIRARILGKFVEGTSCENQAFIIIHQLERLESPVVTTTARNARVLGREKDYSNALSYFEVIFLYLSTIHNRLSARVQLLSW